MSARKKKTTRKSASSSARSRARRTIDAGLRDLEKRLPGNLRGPVRELRSNIKALQKQVDKARQEREERWRRLEAQVRRDTASLLRRLERAVAKGGAKSTSRKKKAGKKKSAKKKTTRRKKAPRKKSSRKKTSRKKTSRR